MQNHFLTLAKQIQWNSQIFNQENAFETAIWQIATICLGLNDLTHWGRVTHICVSELPNIGSDNGLSPGRRQAIIWTNAGILLIGTLGIDFSEILREIHIFSFKKMYLKMLSGKRWSFCIGLNVLMLLPAVTWMQY